jgi:hypothetical protein
MRLHGPGSPRTTSLSYTTSADILVGQGVQCRQPGSGYRPAASRQSMVAADIPTSSSAGSSAMLSSPWRQATRPTGDGSAPAVSPPARTSRGGTRGARSGRGQPNRLTSMITMPPVQIGRLVQDHRLRDPYGLLIPSHQPVTTHRQRKVHLEGCRRYLEMRQRTRTTRAISDESKRILVPDQSVCYDSSDHSARMAPCHATTHQIGAPDGGSSRL